MSEPIVRRHVVIEGFVQGVFFRDTTSRHARQHGVSGWVRNLGDGSVEAIFEGKLDAVEHIVSFCHQGPPGARVQNIHVREEDPEGLASFEVR